MRPIKSTVARRRKARSSIMGASCGAAPLTASFSAFRMRLAMAAASWREAGAFSGIKCRSARPGTSFLRGLSTTPSGHLAPSRTQSFSQLRYGPESGSASCGIKSSCPRGRRMRRINSLFSTGPDTTAGPLVPPLRKPSFVSSRSPPLAFSAPWQRTQAFSSTVWTCSRKLTSAEAIVVEHNRKSRLRVTADI